MTELSNQLIALAVDNITSQKANTLKREAAGLIDHDTAVKEIYEYQLILKGISIAYDAIIIGEAEHIRIHTKKT
jgi:hypothetical protein